MSHFTIFQRAAKRPRLVLSGAALVAAAALGLTEMTAMAGPGGSRTTDATSATMQHGDPCTPASPSGTPQPPKPTTLATLQQAFWCILDHTYIGPEIDDRTLFTAAFKNVTRELDKRGQDLPIATLPKLTGHRDTDWAAFAATYQAVLNALPNDPALQQELASAVIQGMISAIGDNHDVWTGQSPPSPAGYDLGILPMASGRATADIKDANPPVYVSTVVPGSPSAQAGLKPGDVIESVDGVPMATNGLLNPGVLTWLRPTTGDPVRLTLQRPATGKTWSVTLTPTPPSPGGPGGPAAPGGPAGPGGPSTVTVTLVDGDLADVTVPDFNPGRADDALNQIAALRKTHPLRGIILDLRGNGGGREEEVARLLGAFTHGKTIGWNCLLHGACTPDRTDDTAALLGLRFVELTNSFCASACEEFTSAVKDLKLGKLVGARTAGVIAGKPSAYTLDDNSSLVLVDEHQLAPNGESVDQIGVAVDYAEPMTAADVSKGLDPAVSKAEALLGS